MGKMIYLDNAATTYPKPECVYEALDNANRNYAFNAGRGSYEASKNVFRMISETRKKVGDIVGEKGTNVVFTSSATESLNLIIDGLGLEAGDCVYISPFEHNAIVRPLYHLVQEQGVIVKILPFDKKTWLPDLKQINNLFALNRPKAVLLSHLSNVTGYMLPYSEIFSLSKKLGSINVLDCAQSFGIVPIQKKDVDFAVFAGHKSLYASFGVAGFVKLGNFNLKVVKSGGTGSDSLNHDMPDELPARYEAGSLNSVAIAGLSASLDWLKRTDVFSSESSLTAYMIKKLKQVPKIVLYLPQSEEIFGTISFNVKGYSANDVGTILSEEYNICVRTGYHCAPFVHDFIESRQYSGTVRSSLGAFNSNKDIDSLAVALKTL